MEIEADGCCCILADTIKYIKFDDTIFYSMLRGISAGKITPFTNDTANANCSDPSNCAYLIDTVKANCSIKAVDIITYNDETKVLGLIELKDYSNYDRTKAIHIEDEIALKVRDSLAGILSASMTSDEDEKKFFKKALKMNLITAILCIRTNSSFDKKYSSYCRNVQTKLRQKLKNMVSNVYVLEDRDGNPFNCCSHLH